MDTKWNNTDPGGAIEQAVSAEVAAALEDGGNIKTVAPKLPKRWKGWASLISLVLGLCLILGSLASAAAYRPVGESLQPDWRQTAHFRAEVSQYVEDFLTLAAGGELDWYSQAEDMVVLAPESGDWWGDVATTEALPGILFSTTDEAVAVEPEEDSATATPAPSDPEDADLAFRRDKNVLYRVTKDGKVLYANADGALSAPPEGYGFFLTYWDGKVTITQDGQALDVYGDGIYDGGDDWFVPGYDNFPAGDGVEGVSFTMAVRDVPVRYYLGDYANGGASSYGRIYWVYQYHQDNRQSLFLTAGTLAAGLVLLVLAAAWRKDRPAACRPLARVTRYVWTEVRFLLVAAPAAVLAFAMWYYWLYCDFGFLPALGQTLLRDPGQYLTLPFLLLLWLIHNDHKYNPKTERRSLLRSLARLVRDKSLRLPVQKRLRAVALGSAAALAVGLLLGMVVFFLLFNDFFWYIWSAICAAVILSLLVLTPALVLSARRLMGLAHDIGALDGQINAIRAGDYTTPLDLPGDSDLRQMAEQLNDIQSGLAKALAEQTRSERMKVELISNVSHDLKTPLTSILSYAELLRQEPLEGAAADYTRIIGEKAQRLNAMVQDVFEVSKAASDQLPVTLERLDMAKLLRQTLADLDEPIQASRLAFKIDLPETPVMVVADGKRLYRVFQNLITNALQYALEGSRVYLTLTARDGLAETTLRNTSRTELPEGVDFTARFVRGDESRTDGGSGLGLSIASSFTAACGGDFRVETVADLFTAVVTFPLAK